MPAFRFHQSLIPREKPVWFLPLFMLLPAKRRRSFQTLFIVYFKMTSDYLFFHSDFLLYFLPLDGRHAVRIIVPIVARVRGLRFRVAVHRRRAHEGVGTDRNRLPLRCSAAVINGFQRVALSERHISDARHAVRNDDARKPVAICKCTFAYARYTGRNDYACKIVTASKCKVAYAGYAASDGYARKPVAICKCTFAYARYAVRDDDARKTVAICKCKVAYAGYAASDG